MGALLRILRAALRERLAEAYRRKLEARLELGAFCWLVCPNCRGAMPRYRQHLRRFCSRRCARQMRKRGAMWVGLSGRLQYEMLLTLGVLKEANRLVSDAQGGSYAGSSENAIVSGSAEYSRGRNRETSAG